MGREISTIWKAIILFTVALVARVLFLQWVGLEYVGWYHDSFHHWQIAIYTLRIGLAQNPPRMWDLSGQEYFWGLLPTLTESFLLYVFNTTSLAPFRVFNTLMGSLSVVLVYFLGRRFINEQAGLLAGVSSALSPVLWEVDTSGMLDPMGITFLLLGLFLYRKNRYLSGLVLGLASLAHIEFWFLSLAIIGFYLVYERSATDFIPAIAGWSTPMLPYFYFTQTRTGDWLYSLRFNYVASISGQWISNVTVPFSDQILPRVVFLAILALCVASILWMLKKRPLSYPLHSFFLTRVSMQGIIFGMTAYVVPYIAFGQIPRVLIDRLFALDYYYIPILVAVFMAWLIKKRHLEAAVDSSTARTSRVSILGVFALVLIINGAFFPFVVSQYFADTYRGPYVQQVQMADFIASEYRGGTVVSSLVIVNYRLINDGLSLQNVLGSLYCPPTDSTEAYQWLRSHNVTWIIADDNMKVCYPSLLNSDTTPFHIAWDSIYTVNQEELQRLIGT